MDFRLNVLLVTVAILGMAVGTTHAADNFGIGTTVNSSGNTLYVALRSNSLMIEPTFYSYRNERSDKDGSGFYELNNTEAYGIGILLLNTLDDDAKVEAYWGLRLTTVSIHTDWQYLDQNLTTVTAQENGTALVVEPTLGIQYFFTPKYSLSVDVSYFQQNGTVDQIVDGLRVGSYDHDFSGTRAKVILRGYFR